MKRWVGLSLLLIPLLASAASFWDGNAALQRGDATFEAGLFAASNSFQQDTEIQIDNLDTGKSAQATVVQRIDGQADILVLVSPKTASALGISQGTLARVRVTLVVRPGSGASSLGESAYSLDPDVNPGAAYGGAEPAATAQAAAAADTQADTCPADRCRAGSPSLARKPPDRAVVPNRGCGNGFAQCTRSAATGAESA
jgi:hypothetical protein